MQPALDGSEWQREGLGRQFLALALQVAEDDQDPAAARGSRSISSCRTAALASCRGGSTSVASRLGGRALEQSTATRCCLGPGGRSRGDPVQPGTERVLNPEARAIFAGARERSPGRHPGRHADREERCADAKDHRPMPLDKAL